MIEHPNNALSSRHYPCGCLANGPGDLPDYCPTHGSSQRTNQWRPIETAPKDGTEIILYHPSETFEGNQYPARVSAGAWLEWTNTVSEYHASTGVYLGQSVQNEGAMWMSNDGGFREDSPPTHWMPLPEPPEEEVK